MLTQSPLQSNVFTVQSASSSSSYSSKTLSYMKIKTLFQTLIISHMCRFVRAVSKVKSLVSKTLKEYQLLANKKHSYYNKKRHKKVFCGSFRLHYNWCASKSSHVLPVPAPVYDGCFTNSATNHLYNDSTWNTVIPEQQEFDDCPETSELSGYLQWLEEKKQQVKSSSDDQQQEAVNDIDKLADMFIASCHEKFLLEKQESYRRFQEMIARGV